MRLKADQPKAFVKLCGKSLLEWSVDAFAAVKTIERIVVALPGGVDPPQGTIGVVGGRTRSDSVAAGLAEVGDAELIVVHDAARPLVSVELIERVMSTLANNAQCDGAIAAIPVTNTIKEVNEKKLVQATLDRSKLWSVQTPQAFRHDSLVKALDCDATIRAEATDDAWLLERIGENVCVVESEPSNIKVTTPIDLRLAEILINERKGI